jgi:hypothetical protein
VNIKKVRNSVVVALLFAVAAYAATKGDPSPFGKYGVVQIAGYDAGTGAPKCFGIANQNSIMVRNFILDGGTTPTMYCGFDTSVSHLTGMPVLGQESFTVDITAVVGSTPIPFDGGVTAASPQLCCIEAPGGAPSDLHWMIVK